MVEPVIFSLVNISALSFWYAFGKLKYNVNEVFVRTLHYLHYTACESTRPYISVSSFNLWPIIIFPSVDSTVLFASLFHTYLRSATQNIVPFFWAASKQSRMSNVIRKYIILVWKLKKKKHFKREFSNAIGLL